MSDKKPKQERISAVPPFGLRMLPEMRARIEAAAAGAGRSMNAEILFRLEASFRLDDDLRLEDEALKGVVDYRRKQLGFVQSEFEFANNYVKVLSHRLRALQRDIALTEEHRKALKPPASHEDTEGGN